MVKGDHFHHVHNDFSNSTLRLEHLDVDGARTSRLMALGHLCNGCVLNWIFTADHFRKHSLRTYG